VVAPATTKPAPKSIAELWARAEALAGSTLGAIAARQAVGLPPDLRRHKGMVGELLERALGASAGSRAEPDFPNLGVELKTLPVDRSGRPLESTFVCSIPPGEIGDVEWEQSRVRRKLAHVLWLPVEAMRSIPLAQRLVGSPLLWSPSPDEEAELRFDWEELAGLIGRGEHDAITGHLGKWLQVRPKAANAQARRRAFDAEGGITDALPRGFYLRTQFTARIVQQAYRTSD
jgi:DNA mismatch repair protein MutH